MKLGDIPIKEVMHHAPFTISPAHTLAAAKKMMQEHNIRHLPVRSGSKLVGVLSDRDIYFLLASEQKSDSVLKVEDALTDAPYIVEVSTPLSTVARRMAQDKIGSALVVEKDRCVGIFTTVDACRVLAQTLNGESEH